MMAFMRQLVRGFIWKCRMLNGALFQFWTPTSQLTRAEARAKLLAEANGDYEEVYSKRDIDSLRRCLG